MLKVESIQVGGDLQLLYRIHDNLFLSSYVKSVMLCGRIYMALEKQKARMFDPGFLFSVFSGYNFISSSLDEIK